MASTVKLNPAFGAAVLALGVGIQAATEDAMAAAMEVAEQDAQALKRWRDPGTYSEDDRAGNTWVWQVTGQATASITAYVVGHRQPKALNPAPQTTVTRNGHAFRARTHSIDTALEGTYAPQPGVVTGVVTMNVAYAPFLQRKELGGAVWGIPSAGQPVTLEVLALNWSSVYVPQIIAPRIERAMNALRSRL